MVLLTHVASYRGGVVDTCSKLQGWCYRCGVVDTCSKLRGGVTGVVLLTHVASLVSDAMDSV